MFFVIGAGRSGTSLLATALDGHPDLTVAFEYRTIDILLGRSPRWAGRPPQERVDGFLAVCRRAAASAGTGRWGNKVTTEQLAGVAPDRVTLDALFAGPFAGMPVVAITRDRQACVRSKMRRAGLSFEEADRRWRFSTTVLAAVEASALAVHRLRYEDLVADPEGVLSPACAFLGVGFHPAVLANTQSAAMPPEYRREGFHGRP